MNRNRIYGASTTFARMSLPLNSTGTFHANRMMLDKTTAVTSIIREAHMAYLFASVLPEIDDDYTDEEELEWDTLFAQPHVQAGLDQLAEEAKGQFLAGKTVEGGFAVE